MVLVKRTLDLNLVPVTALAAVPGDACPFIDCPTGRLVYDSCGHLVCADCNVDAVTVEKLVHEHRAGVAS
ncbi:hypothetical protein [Actinoplanes sp. URMC 104]|uniref:hypothetical protein n=1 Tax=Actinoplanes sp. URMC 104 TaxID=3423409 RepID=UPI003F1D60DC